VPAPTIFPVIRSILSADFSLTNDEVVKRAKARGITAPDANIRKIIYNVRGEMKKKAAITSTAAASAGKTVVSAKPTIPAPKPTASAVQRLLLHPPVTRADLKMKEFPLSKVYQLLEPGPVVLLTTSIKGRANVMTMSWHMMVEFEPPLVACVVSSANYSFGALRATRECVIAVPAVELAAKVVEIGNSTGCEIDKFKTLGLTPVAAECVGPPLIAECFANLEGQVIDTRLVNKYNLFILEVLKAWIDPKQKNPKTIHHRGYGAFAVDGQIIKFKSKKP
jgi:flavin reductase (DIM6/NTAB) family NADH-FMN oxidoreductase RutF